MKARAALVLCLLAACERKAIDRPGDCLPLPGAARASLIADPRGGGLYWLEPVRRFDYDAKLTRYWNLVRFDLHSRRLESLYDHVEGPVYILGDKMVMVRTNEGRRLVLQSRGGHAQELLPDYLSPLDAEMIDGDSLAVLADGDGPRAVYTLDLDRPRPHVLHDADTVLSSKDGVVYTWVGQDGVAIDAKTGLATSFEQKDHSMPLGDELLYVDGDEVVALSMATGTSRTVISDRRKWKLVHQRGAVLARTRPERDRSFAVLIEAGGVTPLPTLVGGTSILGAARLGDQMWALVGHNTPNYDGDIGDIEAETEVCLLPEGGEVTFKTRTVPGRFVHKEHALAAALARISPRASFQILDTPGLATEVFIELPEPSRDDWAAMRERVTRLHQQVTSLLEDPEVMTEIRYADLRSAVYRYRRMRLEGRATSGMGDVTIADASAYDLEISELTNAYAGDEQWHCKGTLVNLTKQPLTDLEVRCILGDRENTIAIDELLPGQPRTFDEHLPGSWSSEPLFEVIRNREPLELLDRSVDERQRKLIALGVEVYRDTELALYGHDVNETFTLRLLARRGFDQRSEAERAAIVERAYEAYDEGLRALYEIDEDDELELTVDVDHSEVAYTYDGDRLTTK
ncbi:MAG TPA: hypothetical protein VM513_36135 [Kofleriaceae bacterium]|nr:hypothetical protein [Kofleriaceae bacterium]